MYKHTHTHTHTHMHTNTHTTHTNTRTHTHTHTQHIFTDLTGHRYDVIPGVTHSHHHRKPGDKHYTPPTALPHPGGPQAATTYSVLTAPEAK